MKYAVKFTTNLGIVWWHNDHWVSTKKRRLAFSSKKAASDFIAGNMEMYKYQRSNYKIVRFKDEIDIILSKLERMLRK